MTTMENMATSPSRRRTVEPNTLVTAMQGSRYTRKNTNNTTEWFKDTGTGNTGWVLHPVGVERLSTNGAASFVKQTTFISGVGTNVTLANHFSDLETWVSVRETPVGTSRDARVSDLSPGAGPEGCGQGSGGRPGGTVVAPGVALRRSPRSAGRAEAGLLKPGQRC